ncbi:type II toxin-antitoxin system mRNA interferase toxin, RelE/StbE family [Candidatus Woesearchaeota archaeon]|nr:type II toxin-antitoxin system mRNA interferase toxin, RelE/StbE family [Candidatus Woesearchaeota archaeon]
MPEWIVQRTETFLNCLKKQRNNHELLSELEKKLQKLEEEPLAVGGNLAGNLHGYRSTRLARKFRLIFTIDENNKIVTLEALDHRKDVYD